MFRVNRRWGGNDGFIMLNSAEQESWVVLITINLARKVKSLCTWFSSMNKSFIWRWWGRGRGLLWLHWLDLQHIWMKSLTLWHLTLLTSWHPSSHRFTTNQTELCKVPSCFKRTVITPVPKKSSISGRHDLRPIALMSAVKKSFERLLVTQSSVVTSSGSRASVSGAPGMIIVPAEREGKITITTRRIIT